MPQKNESALFSAILILLSVTVALAAGELVLRVKNSSMKTYDIEMWRYAKDLKVQSPDPDLDFDHVRSKASVLENVTIRLNEWGLRGGPVEPLPSGGRRILFLGGSITLGWGVPEDQTVEARLEDQLRRVGMARAGGRQSPTGGPAGGENAAGEAGGTADPAAIQVLNGGVGNYNADRYVSRFFKELQGLNPTDIVVHYFLRDAEDLPPGGGNLILRHSELGVTLWIAYHRLFDKAGEQTLVDHYKAVYQPDAPGFLRMQAKLKELADYGKAHGIRLYFAMTPDVHNLVDYKFGFVHELMRRIAQGDGYTYVDLLPAMLGRPPAELFAMPGDPHPNALGHQLMADAIFPVVRLPPAAAADRAADAAVREPAVVESAAAVHESAVVHVRMAVR